MNPFKPIVVILLLFISGYAQAQYTITLNPSTTEVEDVALAYLTGDAPLPYFPGNKIYCWQQNGAVNYNRAILRFGFEGMPQDILILNAKLILYYNTTTTGGIDGHFGQNSFFIKRIIEPWSELTATWNNQPATTDEHTVQFGPISGYSNAVIDVTLLVQDMFDDPDQSFGFKMQLVDESLYKAVLFASKDHPDISLHPELIITYLHTTDTQEEYSSSGVVVYPNPSSGLIQIRSIDGLPIQSVRVFNALGQQVQNLQGAITELQIEAAGIYYLEIQTEYGKSTEKVVVNK
ncbi:MAG: DNRLRE domain-containing protein [Saprospiraceae bacterium]